MIAGSVSSRWFGAIPAVSANQNRDSPVSTRPLSGTSVGSTTSNALMRSDATSSNRPSGSSYRSRTLPDRRNRSAVSMAYLGRRRQRVEPFDDCVDVAQERGLVEACVEIGERQALGHHRIDGEQLAQRRSLVGGAQGGPLHDRVGLVAADA